jgi:hypothetical protein
LFRFLPKVGRPVAAGKPDGPLEVVQRYRFNDAASCRERQHWPLPIITCSCSRIFGIILQAVCYQLSAVSFQLAVAGFEGLIWLIAES